MSAEIKKLPGFLYLGTDKAGSTWLSRALAEHPGVFVPAAKDIYFFDREYQRGLQWYARHFAQLQEGQVGTEICHDYMYSPLALERIRRHLPDARCLIHLRDPVRRAYSAYVNYRRVGLLHAAEDFWSAAEKYPDILERGYYSRHVSSALELLGSDTLKIVIFEDIWGDLSAYFESLWSHIGVEQIGVPAGASSRVLEASSPRLGSIVMRQVKGAAVGARRLGLARGVGIIKSARIVERALFRPANVPQLQPEDRRVLRGHYADDVSQLSEIVGVDMTGRWWNGDC